MPAHNPTATPAVLRAQGISHAIGGRIVLHDVSATLAPGTRLGVVGPNGVGKSTLLRVLAGSLVADAGSVVVTPPSATVGYLSQEHERSEVTTVEDHLRQATGVGQSEEALQRAALGLSEGAEGAADRYAEELERWLALGADDFDTRLAEVVGTVGLEATILALSTAALSGGEMARVALAAVLLSRFDIVLLDEPTNDLDFTGLDLLERFVMRREGTTVIVSHDREFLDRTIDAVLELDEHSRQAQLYRGGWSQYVAERATQRRHAEEAFALYQERRSDLMGRARRERQWATQGVNREKRRPTDHDKAQRDFRVNRTEQLASRARRTERALDRLDVVDKPWEGWDLRFGIEETARAGSVVVRLEDAVVDRGEFKLGPVDLEIAWGERVWLSGRNGSGKTTLLGAILGHLDLTSGTRWIGPSVVVGELDQRRSWGSDQSDLLGAFLADTGLTLSEGRSLLAKFGLGPAHVDRPLGSLSPGERTRADMARFQAVGMNFLVLDEPTNHLDIPALEQLEAALETYAGTLLVVSHDRRLLETVSFTREIAL